MIIRVSFFLRFFPHTSLLFLHSPTDGEARVFISTTIFSYSLMSRRDKRIRERDELPLEER